MDNEAFIEELVSIVVEILEIVIEDSEQASA